MSDIFTNRKAMAQARARVNHVREKVEYNEGLRYNSYMEAIKIICEQGEETIEYDRLRFVVSMVSLRLRELHKELQVAIMELKIEEALEEVYNGEETYNH